MPILQNGTIGAGFVVSDDMRLAALSDISTCCIFTQWRFGGSGGEGVTGAGWRASDTFGILGVL
jgi:hypothetical protein